MSNPITDDIPNIASLIHEAVRKGIEFERETRELLAKVIEGGLVVEVDLKTETQG